MSAITIAASDLDYIRELVFQKSGIAIPPDQRDDLVLRLQSLAHRRGLESVPDLLSALRSGEDSQLPCCVIAAVTTGGPSFWCDAPIYELLKSAILPELLGARQTRRDLHVWCTNCGYGQGPYSLAILLREHFPVVAARGVRILATDRSPSLIEQAGTGCYSQAEVCRGLPAELLTRYFRPKGLEWQVDEDLHNMLEFRTINLADHWPAMPAFDLVLLRNVLLYYDTEVRKGILARMRRLLQPDGYLVLGENETIADSETDREWALHHPLGCYQPCHVETAHAPS
jgi:chemotaxis protein methyltransferase CheR